jgi:CheY-like chemotaxis protein
MTVADTGSGIPADVLEHVFEPFFTTKPRDKGTGLGLSTVYGIVRSHGGVVEVKTEIGVGTEFTVLIPAGTPQLLRTASHPPMTVGLSGNGRLILVVDDEESIRIITVRLLENLGFTVIAAEDGEDGLAKFRENQGRLAAIVTDVMMPRLNGGQMAQQIRRLDPNIPIVVSSGLSADGMAGCTKADLERIGIQTVLTKPYTEDLLLRALRKELREPAG